MFQFPGFAFVPYVFKNKYFKSVNSKQPAHAGSLQHTLADYWSLEVGFPIRKSKDQSLFAAPLGLSQRTTSFIASQRQGIHRIPLWHLIALIIETHPLGRVSSPHQAETR